MSLRPAAGKILLHGRSPTYGCCFRNPPNQAILRSHTLFAVPPRTHRPALDALYHRHFGTRGGGSGDTQPSDSGSSNNTNNNTHRRGDAPQGGKPATNHQSNNNNNNNNDNDGDKDESHLNWKDRQQAPKWMRRIAPTKGGKWPPSPQEAVILSAGVALFVWSWSDLML